ncbi:MAG: helix-turn-helix domain-containing protein [Candidatus Methanofastidiosia archaeon]|jgi:predicted DNA binding protein
MRKVTITLEGDLLQTIIPPTFFDVVDSIEAKIILRIDIEKGVKIAVCDIKLKDEYTLDDVKFPDEWKILDVLKKIDNTYTCLLKTEYSIRKKIKELYNEEYFIRIQKVLQLDVIFDTPFSISKEKIVVTCVVKNEILKQFLDIINELGEFKTVSFKHTSFSEYNILSCLTTRQKEVVTTAQKSGYYDMPRKISTEELSKKLGIGTSTTLEHLRKAEHRILSSILEGY